MELVPYRRRFIASLPRLFHVSSTSLHITRLFHVSSASLPHLASLLHYVSTQKNPQPETELRIFIFYFKQCRIVIRLEILLASAGASVRKLKMSTGHFLLRNVYSSSSLATGAGAFLLSSNCSCSAEKAAISPKVVRSTLD